MKICEGCGKKIIEKKERFTHIEDWAFAKIVGNSWWHLNCFKKAMNRDITDLEKQAGVMLQRAGAIYDNLPEELTLLKSKEKEFIIK